MARFFRKKTFIVNPFKICDGQTQSVEEVGVDIAEALAIINFNPQPLNKPNERLILNSAKNVEVKKIGKQVKFEIEENNTSGKRVKNKNRKQTLELKKSCAEINLRLSINPLLELKLSNLKRQSEEFVRKLYQEELLANEKRSKLNSSSWPTVAQLKRKQEKNQPCQTVYEAHVTIGHLKGDAKPALLCLSSTSVSLKRPDFEWSLELWALSHFLLDDCWQSCCIVGTKRGQTICCENFSAQNLGQFLQITEYLIREKWPQRRDLLHSFAWDHVLRCPVVSVHCVSLTIEGSAFDCGLHLETEAMYKLENMSNDEVSPIISNNWIPARLVLKLNTLYLYEDCFSDDLPHKFWLMTESEAVTELEDVYQDNKQNHILELVHGEDILFLSFASREQLQTWLFWLQKSQVFRASQFYSGEDVKGRKDVCLALTPKSLKTFNFLDHKWLTYHETVKLTHIQNIIANGNKPHCTIVFRPPGDLNGDAVKWTVTFLDCANNKEFVRNLERLWRID